MKKYLFLIFGLLALFACEPTVVEPENPLASICHLKHTDTAQPYWINRKANYHENGTVLTVGFYSGTQEQKEYTKRWISHVDSLIGLDFEFISNVNDADIRIQFNPSLGAYSYVGKDIFRVSKGRETMNLGFRTGSGSTVIHELLHTLNFLHAQQNPTGGGINFNKSVVYADLAKPPNNWTKGMVDSNVLFTHDPTTVDASAIDFTSIMMYNLPCRWVIGGVNGQTCNMSNHKLSSYDIARLQEIYEPIDEVEWLFPKKDSIPPVVPTECPNYDFDYMCAIMQNCAIWNFNNWQLIQTCIELDIPVSQEVDSRDSMFFRINRKMHQLGCYTCFY